MNMIDKALELSYPPKEPSLNASQYSVPSWTLAVFVYFMADSISLLIYPTGIPDTVDCAS